VQQRFLGLDGIRAIAVLLVYIEHKVIFRFSLGALGVDLFFTLSGFLIVGILHGQRRRIEDGGTGFGPALARFWRQRARRIFPVYYLTLAVLLALAVAQGRGVFADGLVPWYLLLSANVYIGQSLQWGPTTHFWSLGVEQHFYLLIAPLLLWLRASLHRPALQLLLLASLGAMLLQYLAGAPSRAIYVSSWANFSFMAVGGLLALAGPSERRRGLALPACVLATVALMLFTQTRLRWAVDPAAGRLLFNMLALVIGVALVQHVVAHPAGRLTRALESAGPRNLGVVSYGFYVFHNLIPAIPRLGLSPGWAALSIATHFAACVALSALSWHLLEKRLLGRRLTRAPGGELGAARAQPL
jgi:peptidoglycan/LPS O-acetylase OafA/YrhL